MKLLIAFLVWIQLFCFVIGDELELRESLNEKGADVLSRTRREEIDEEQEYVELMQEEEELRDPRAIQLRKKYPADKMRNWRRMCWGVCQQKKNTKKYFKRCSTYKLKKTQKFCLKCRWGVKACKLSTITVIHA